MGEDNVTKTVLDLDNAEFLAKMQESLGLLGEFGKAENLEGLISGLQSIGLIAGVAGVAFLAIKTALDLTEESEHIEQVNRSFQMLAQSAGLVADTLKEDLVKAAGGLAGETELLQAANRAIVEMGGNASKIPQTMEIARKATVVFGGDLISNFEGINRALANGNVRMLRQYGIVIDTTKAHQEYAKSLGVGVEFLSQAGQKQAVMNAALAQATEKFKDIDVNATPVSNNIARIGVAFTEMKEKLVSAFAASVSPFVEFLTGPSSLKMMITTIGFVADSVGVLVAGFKTLIVGVAAAGDIVNGTINSFSKFGQGIWAVVSGNEALKKSLNESTTKLGTINFSATQKAYESLVSTVTAKPIFKDLLADLEKAEKKAKEASTASTVKGPDPIDHEKMKQAEIKFQTDILKIQEQALKDSEKTETTKEGFTKIRDAEMVTTAQEASQKIEKLRVEGLNKGLMSEQQYAASVAMIQKKLAADIQLIRNKENADEIKALQNLQDQNSKTAVGFSAAWHKNGAMASKDIQDMGKLGENSFKAMSSHAITAFKAIGDGSQNAADALKSAMFGAIGAIAEQEGEYLVLAGIASYDFVQAAEGAALIALGAAISGMGGGSSGVVSGSSSGGGGSASPAAATAATAAPAPQAAQTKNVQIAINGNIFETEQTKQRLVDMIRQASDATDFEFKKIGTA